MKHAVKYLNGVCKPPTLVETSKERDSSLDLIRSSCSQTYSFQHDHPLPSLFLLQESFFVSTEIVNCDVANRVPLH